MILQHEIAVRSALDIITARVEVRDFARRCGLSLTEQAIISMVISMLASSLGLGGVGVPEGRIHVESCQKDNRTGVRVHCHQTGTQISRPSTAPYEKLVDEIDLNMPAPDAVEVVLTMWAKTC